MSKQIERVTYHTQLICIIIRSDFEQDGIEFFTPPEMSQQLAYMKYNRGKKIDPHIHKVNNRNINYTQEVLFIKSGKVRVYLFGPDKEYLCERALSAGDLIMLCSGGHGFEVDEAVEMIEVKQGPYIAEDDKVRFYPEGWE